MQLTPFTLLPGESKSLNIAGSTFILYDLGGAPGVDIALLRNGSSFISAANVQRGLTLSPIGSFTGVSIGNPDSVAHTVRAWILKDGEGSVTFADNLTVSGASIAGAVGITNTDANPVPVKIDGGDVIISGPITVSNEVEIKNDSGNPIPVNIVGAGVTVALTQAGTLTEHGGFAITASLAAVLPALAGRKLARFANTGAVPVALGGAALSFAGAVIVLQPGDMWSDNDAAPAAWYAVTATGAGALTIQEGN